MKYIILILCLILPLLGCDSKSGKNLVKIESHESDEIQDNVEEIDHLDFFNYPQIIGKGNDLSAFIPTGWVILDSVSFDYNYDSLLDFVLVIETVENVSYKQKWGEYEMDTNDKPRVLLVLTGNDYGFSLSCQANELILSSDQGGMAGDPFEGLNVSGNKICTYYWGGSREKWSLSHCFTFQDGKWLLTYVETHGGHAELTYNMNYDVNSGNFNYKYVQEEYHEENDSIAIIKEDIYSKIVKTEDVILMDSFRPWTLKIDSVYF